MSYYCFNCMSERAQGQPCRNCAQQNNFEVMPHHLRPGQVLNQKYLVGKAIGEGGFGITYIGRDLVLDVKIAIKEFYPSGYVNRNNTITQEVTTASEEQRRFFNMGKSRFLHEAQNVAKFIGEPGIVGVREYFEANGTAYIIMEYLDGMTLSKYIRQHGPFEPKKIFSLMLPIMQSLQKVHDAGIIHRDISPDNIMYMRNGALKLMDFGSARYFTNEEKDMSIMLKRGYSPEEQYRKNGHQGPWTDVYGLCATIYRCITGYIPEDALDRASSDTLKRPSAMGVHITQPLESVLLYGLAVFSSNRCKNMVELKNLVERALQSQPVNIRQVAPVNYANQQPNIEYRPQPRISQEEYRSSNTQPQKEKSSSTVAIVCFIIVLFVLALVAVGVYFYLQYESDKKDSTDDAVVEVVTEDVSSTEPVTEEPTEKETEAETEEETQEPTQVTEYDDATEFVAVTASSTLPDYDGYDFNVYNLLVDDSTCWTEGAQSYGEGEWVHFELPEVQKLSGLRIINGYAGTVEQYNRHSSVKKIEIEFSNGQTTSVTLDALDASKRKSVTEIRFGVPVNTSYVRIYIESVYEGETDNTSITYVEPF